MNTLIVSFLPREGSNTAKIVDAFKSAADGKTEITHRELSSSDLPLINAESISTFWASETDTALGKASAELLTELKAADNIVIAAPVYNFGMPASLKAWFDLVIRAGETFKYGAQGPEGLLDIKNAAVITTSGGLPIGSDYDLMTSHTKMCLGLMGAQNPSVIGASGVNQGSEEEQKALVDKAAAEASELAQAWFN